MKRQPSYGFNKEKLIFLATAALLAGSVYNFMSTKPVILATTTPVSPVSIPAPLAADKLDTRKADVHYYLESGIFGDFAVNRERKNPFEPFDTFVPDATAITKNNNPAPKNPQPKVDVPIAPDEIVAEKPEKKEAPKTWEDQKAQVDFSAVVTMNGLTYGLLKDKKGTTIQVKVGDYMDEFKYTVAKIEKQAIWVTDENDHLFVARDMSFLGDGSEVADGEEKPKKKTKPKPAAEPAPAPKPVAQPTNNNNNKKKKNNGNGRNGNNNNGNSNNNNGYSNNNNYNNNNNGNLLNNFVNGMTNNNN